jgi:MFS transporter, DHA1 family, tetracycline resistance protein
LYAAGFTTAFGAHAVAANLGVYTGTRHGSLLTLGILLALHDGAEVVLKPVFGALADRVGGKPVLLGGLIAFAAASGGFLLAGSTAALFAARIGQGAGAAAFSPAASMLVARLAPPGRAGRSAATAHGRAWAMPLARCWAAPWSRCAGMACSSLSLPPWAWR